MDLIAVREFLLSTYHDLPNVIFMGSLLLGSMFGYLPLVWVAVGMMFNGAVVSILQGIIAFVFPNWAQVVVPSGSYACEIFKTNVYSTKSGSLTVVAPSHWLSALSLAFILGAIPAGKGHSIPTSESFQARQASLCGW